ncbi:hypothetical protein C8T65DRAFT_745255 [Cerioporus squamosus]|nr:hypothetical protein C8T65DRAFT_745255 [Cerioporus squamosus]
MASRDILLPCGHMHHVVLARTVDAGGAQAAGQRGQPTSTYQVDVRGCEVSRLWLNALAFIVHDLLEAREARISLLQEALQTSGNLTREFQALYQDAERARVQSDQELARIKGMCDCRWAEGLRDSVANGHP